MKMKTQQPKPMGFSKSSAKREVNSNTSLPQETREASHKQPNFTSKVTRKKIRKTLKLAEGTKIIKFRAEIKEKEMKETIANSNKKKSWFFKKINKIDQLLARLLKKRKKGKESNQ